MPSLLDLPTTHFSTSLTFPDNRQSSDQHLTTSHTAMATTTMVTSTTPIMNDKLRQAQEKPFSTIHATATHNSALHDDSSPLKPTSSFKKVRFALESTEDPNTTHNTTKAIVPEKIDSIFPDHSDEADVYKFVGAAITGKIRGDSTLYYKLLNLVAKRSTDSDALTPAQLCLYLKSFTLNVSKLSSTFQPLIMAILSIQWLGNDNTFSHIYCQFLENLVSAHAVYVSPVAKTLVQSIRNCLKLYPQLLPSQLFDRIHTALERILHLVPTGPSFLLSILTVNFPHKTQDIEIQIFYVKSLLRITEYAPILRNQIISVIVEGVVQVDVAIQIEIEELNEEELEAIQETVFSMDDLDVNSSAASFSQGSENNLLKKDENYVDPAGYESDESNASDGVGIIVADIKSMVEKLDAMLSLLFQYVTDIHIKSMKDTFSESKDITNLFYAFLDIFDRVMIPTHRLRCTQFLLFYMSSFNKTFPNDFMGLLVSRLFQVESPLVIRISSAAYLGSYLSRAKYVDISSVRTCLGLLNQFTQSYLDNNESSMGPRINVERFGVLYSAVQAILYVFCFRWKELMLTGSEDKVSIHHGQLPPELKDFQRVLMSRFAPLRVCSETIVQEFAKIMHALDIMYCYPLIGFTSSVSSLQTNVSHISSAPDMVRNASQSSLNSGTLDFMHVAIERLDSFFPFDPITLPKSRGYITPLYQDWVGSNEMESDEEDDPSSLSKDFELDSDIEDGCDAFSMSPRGPDDMSTSLG
ncbi:hypothetical protein BDV3_003962 [Batrachochytrium dendrobatidis]|uniref:RNA polymerase I-specific transcription initiation factor RRN3 n=1 Tax=Batrachochytrium dendrobatidis (strain JEL423) TaxID=403673 RepID=A0A177WF30_BATDL|nr:hypothetical protein BDEG_22344 [Batrachochytrium dendrobatidis JEL423]